MVGGMNDIPLAAGQIAPDFSASTSEGRTVSSHELRGHDVILYFYPKDDTPGCTKEACGFRDFWDRIQKQGFLVFGVSPDSPKSHQKFISKYSLPFPLLADEDKVLAKSFGVWGKKSFMGKTYDGILRTTFWIGADGVIRKVWTQVKAEGHAEEVLAVLQSGK